MKGYFRRRGCTCKKKKCTCGAKWSFTIDIGTDPATGKRRQKTVSGFTTKDEAEKACAELIVALKNGEYTEKSKDTLGKFIQDFMENVSKQTIRTTTYEVQMTIVKNHIIPDLGQIKLIDVTPMTIQKFYQKKLNQGLAPSYIGNIHTILTKAFKTAHEWGMVHRNIMTLVKKPKKQAKEMNTWTIDQAHRFLECVKNRWYYIIYVLAIYTGMRKGEILALKWDDVDLVNGKISVKQTLSAIKGKLIFNEVKTKSSKRVISLPKFALSALKKHKAKQNELILSGEGYEDNNLVAATKAGKPIRPTDVNHDFYDCIEKYKFPRIRFHDLRHTHATILLQLGENSKVVSERLGHSKVGTTLEIYSHVLPDMQKNLASNFDMAMKRAKTKK